MEVVQSFDMALVNCPSNPSHYTCILEDSNFNFRYVRLCDLDILKEKWLNYLQTNAMFCGI